MRLPGLSYRVVPIEPKQPIPPWLFFFLVCAFWTAIIILLDTCAAKVCVARCVCPLLATATCVVDKTGAVGECSCVLFNDSAPGGTPFNMEKQAAVR